MELEKMSVEDLLKWGFDPDCGEYYPEKDAFKILARRFKEIEAREAVMVEALKGAKHNTEILGNYIDDSPRN